MADYYIRTPDHDESRGPFDASKLQTLAEAGQISENTLFYDEGKEEWIPIALSEELKAAVFPQREKLSLKMRDPDELKRDKEDEPDEEDPDADRPSVSVLDMLDAAEGNTAERQELKQRQKSLERSVAVATPAIGVAMIASALTLILPQLDQIKGIINQSSYATILNHPALLFGIFDLIVAILLLLAVTEIYPLVRCRAMLTAGVGLYLGWIAGDPMLMGVAAAAGWGVFLASISQNFTTMIAAVVLGVGGNGYLAYLAFAGQFTEFFAGLEFKFITG